MSRRWSSPSSNTTSDAAGPLPSYDKLYTGGSRGSYVCVDRRGDIGWTRYPCQAANITNICLTSHVNNKSRPRARATEWNYSTPAFPYIKTCARSQWKPANQAGIAGEGGGGGKKPLNLRKLPSTFPFISPSPPPSHLLLPASKKNPCNHTLDWLGCNFQNY